MPMEFQDLWVKDGFRAGNLRPREVVPVIPHTPLCPEEMASLNWYLRSIPQECERQQNSSQNSNGQDK